MECVGGCRDECVVCEWSVWVGVEISVWCVMCDSASTMYSDDELEDELRKIEGEATQGQAPVPSQEKKVVETNEQSEGKPGAKLSGASSVTGSVPRDASEGGATGGVGGAGGVSGDAGGGGDAGEGDEEVTKDKKKKKKAKKGKEEEKKPSKRPGKGVPVAMIKKLQAAREEEERKRQEELLRQQKEEEERERQRLEKVSSSVSECSGHQMVTLGSCGWNKSARRDSSRRSERRDKDGRWRENRLQRKRRKLRLGD